MPPLVATAPPPAAAYSQPYPRAPTRRISCAKIGRSAVADEKNVAKKSSSIVDLISGDRKPKRRPSRAPGKRRGSAPAITPALGAPRQVPHQQQRHDDEPERQSVDDVHPADADGG